MNKSELVDAIANKTGLSKADAAKALAATIESIESSLVKKDSVSLIGFGTFGVKHRPARKGRNPSTQKEIQIPASDVPFFKPGKSLKDSVNK